LLLSIVAALNSLSRSPPDVLTAFIILHIKVSNWMSEKNVFIDVKQEISEATGNDYTHHIFYYTV